jgi:cytoskeletal protein CcmA (bactofilin family)
VQAHDLTTVNGTVRVGKQSTVDGEIEAVNGKISVDVGSAVRKGVSNVNGHIELTGSEVGGDVMTVTGDISLADSAVVKGDLVVEKPSNWGWGKSNNRKPRIVIGPGSVVEGVIRLEREVELYISETAKVGGVEGVMSMDDAVRFKGEQP